MEEAASVRFGRHLRSVFVTILIFIRPSDPVAFWLRHKVSLCEDIMHHERVTEPTAKVITEVLLDIQQDLERCGFALSDFQLPAPDPALLQERGPREIREETNYDIGALRVLLSDNLAKLNQDQMMVFQAVMASVKHSNGHIIGLDAPGGTGKTFLLSTLLAAVRSESKVALATATSGIAATLLPNGRTLHSRFKVPLNITDESTCHISKRDSTAELLRRCHLIVIDEVTMAHRRVYEAVDRTLRDIRETERPFGGITVVLAGDWRQILPVVRKGGRPEIVDACLKTSALWQHVQVMKLTKNMRVLLTGTAAATFADHLLEVGEGRVPVATDVGPHKIRLKEDFVFTGDSLTQLCSHVFHDLASNHGNAEWLCSRAILCPTNDNVEEVNNILIKTFPGQQRVYRSSDKILDADMAHQYPVEFLNTICASGMPHHKLQVKVGCPIMLLRNFDPANGHCNGTRYVVTSLHNHIIEATIATGAHAGNVIFIPRIPIAPSDNIFPFQMQRRQFPIPLCFGITANKAQGQTLCQIGIYLKKDFFAHGQLYVSLSRVGDPKMLTVFAKHGRSSEHDGVHIDNIVYREIL